MADSDHREDNLGYFSHEAARANPDAVALIDLSVETPREVRYGELEERLDRLASLLVAKGLGPGDRLAMAVGNRFEFVEIMFGAMRAGIVPVPLNVKLGADVLAYIIADAGCRGAVVEPACNAFVSDVVDRAGLPVRIAFDPIPAGWDAYEPALQAASASFAPPPLAPDHPSFQPYTSGSTGRPKGVVLTHAGQLWWVRAVQRYWPSRSDGRSLAAVPLYHKNAMAGAIKPKLHAGGSVVLLPGFEPVRFLRALAGYRCTNVGGVPAVFSLLLQHHDLIEELDFGALQTITIGSAPVAKELMDQIEEAFGVPVGESYGLTEGGPVMIGPPLDGRKAPHGSCGVAWPEGEIRLVDGDGRDSPTLGELWVRNPGVSPGYYNLPEVNRERFRDGWLQTGDLFERDGEGFLYFKGRTDDMFNSGGENIYPKEVENLLLSHPAVVDACVVPVPHAVKGEVPVALVMLTAQGAADADQLKHFCLDNGPAYAHPRRIDIVDQIPLNGAGKNDRSVVQRLMIERHGTLGAA
jgi:long-chain acyl-CoA synthetase